MRGRTSGADVASRASTSIPDSSGIMRSHRIASQRSPRSSRASASAGDASTVTSCELWRSRAIERPTSGSSSTTRTRPRTDGTADVESAADEVAARAGSVTRKVVPRPAALSTSHRASRRRDDALADGEPEPGAAGRRREVRLEQALQVVGRNRRAAVVHLDEHLAARARAP